MLEVQIKKTYGAFSLQAEFQAGQEIVGIIGPSGCGKSLTLRSMPALKRRRLAAWSSMANRCLMRRGG